MFLSLSPSTTYLSVDLAHHEIFRAKVGKGGIIQSKVSSHYLLRTEKVTNCLSSVVISYHSKINMIMSFTVLFIT